MLGTRGVHYLEWDRQGRAFQIFLSKFEMLADRRPDDPSPALGASSPLIKESGGEAAGLGGATLWSP